MPSRSIPPAPKPSARRALVVACVVYFAVSHFVPFGTTLLYPLTLLSTWIHEMGHGLTALAVGGSFRSLDVFANGSGLAQTATAQPWQAGLTAIGGLLAPPIVGATILATSRGPQRARILLAGLCVAIVVSLVIWVRSLAGWIALPLVAAAVTVLLHPKMRWGTPARRMIFTQLIGVTLAIDTVSRSGYLFTAETVIDGKPLASDIAAVAQAFGGHYLVWGLLVTAVSFALLALGLYLAWRAPRDSTHPSAARALR